MRRKGNKKCRFCPGKLPNCLTSILFSSSSLFMEFFFQTTFSASKCQEKGRSSTTKRTEVSSFLITVHPFFCVCSPALWWRSFEEAFVEAKWFAERAPAHRRSGKQKGNEKKKYCEYCYSMASGTIFIRKERGTNRRARTF